MRKIFRENYLIIFLFFFIAILTFGKLPFTFFLQDEWLIAGTYLYLDKSNLDWMHRLFIYKQLTHLVPLTHFVSYTQFELFRLHFFLYGISALIIHVVNTTLVYYLSTLFFKKRTLSILAGLFFLTSSISHQGFTWIATTIGTSFSTLFFLLSLIFFTKYLRQKTVRIRYLILFMIFFACSLLFKETSVFGFLFFPVFWLIYKREDIVKAKIASIFFLPLGLLYATIRIVNLLILRVTNSAEVELIQQGIDVYVFRMFILPLRFISQGILPQEVIIRISHNLMKLAYPLIYLRFEDLQPFIAQSVGADIVSTFFSILVIGISIICILSYKKKEQHHVKVLLLSLSFISLSSFPFIFIPGKAGYNSLIDGRHLYATEIFMSILLSTIIYTVYQWFPQKKLRSFVAIALVIYYLFFHISKIRNEMNSLVDIGLIRKSILNTITRLYPKLPERVIFYIESDTAYYGLASEDKILPFQSGFGQTLLVWYNEHGENFPACFFHDQFLYIQESEGYRECDGRGFGYFRNMESLESAIIKQDIRLTDIIGFRYTSSTNKLKDITDSLKRAFVQ